MSEFIRVFDTLRSPDGATGNHFIASQLAGFPDRHIAKDLSGHPAVLFEVLRIASDRAPLNFALENLRVEHEVQCRVGNLQGQTHTGRFTILQCLNDDRGIQDYFLRTMEMMVESLPANAKVAQISDAVEHLIELFQAMRRAPTRTVQGLWAELFLIVQARDSVVLLRAWHDEATEGIDFSRGSERIEVKCSADRMRRHFFSWEQVNPSAGTTQLIASLFVEPAAGGTTVGELWDRARALAAHDSDLRLKVEKVCLDSLGDGWQEARFMAYDAQRAAHSLLFYNVADVPKVSVELPPGVSEVRFRSDLSFAAPVGPASIHDRRELFRAMFGQEA